MALWPTATGPRKAGSQEHRRRAADAQWDRGCLPRAICVGLSRLDCSRRVVPTTVVTVVRDAASIGGRRLLSLSLFPSLSHFIPLLCLCALGAFFHRDRPALEKCSVWGRVRVFYKKLNQLGWMPATRACRRDCGRRTHTARCRRARGPHPCLGPPASSSILYYSHHYKAKFVFFRKN